MSGVRCELLKRSGLLPVSLRDGLPQLCQKSRPRGTEATIPKSTFVLCSTGLLMEPYAYATPVYLTCHKSSLGVCLVLRCCMELGYTQFDVHRNESKLPHVFYDSTSPKAERCCMSNSIRHSVALIIKSRQLKRTQI